MNVSFLKNNIEIDTELMDVEDKFKWILNILFSKCFSNIFFSI